jgi:hypothetical protein
MPVEKLTLSGRVRDLLTEHEIKTAGDILFNLELGDDTLLKLDGLGEKALDEIRAAVANYLPAKPAPVVEPVVEQPAVVEEAPVAAEAEALVAAEEQSPGRRRSGAGSGRGIGSGCCRHGAHAD